MTPELDIASCETIVCVGNGVKDESLDKYRELAKLLGGKLAGTRRSLTVSCCRISCRSASPA